MGRRSQIVTASSRNIRYQPWAFTEHGVTMLASLLKSTKAVQTSIAIVRAFVRMRQFLADNTELAHRVDELEQKSAYHEGQLTLLFDVVHHAINAEEIPHRQIPGFIGES